MKIRLKNDLKHMFYGRITCGLATGNYEWEQLLDKVSGMTLEVETKFLFRDQYNTAPIPGISENGIRAMDWMVAEVIDDERPGKARCGYCGAVTANLTICHNCHKSGYLGRF